MRFQFPIAVWRTNHDDMKWEQSIRVTDDLINSFGDYIGCASTWLQFPA